MIDSLARRSLEDSLIYGVVEREYTAATPDLGLITPARNYSFLASSAIQIHVSHIRMCSGEKFKETEASTSEVTSAPQTL